MQVSVLREAGSTGGQVVTDTLSCVDSEERKGVVPYHDDNPTLIDIEISSSEESLDLPS